MHEKLSPLLSAMFIETNPIPIKQAMDWCGLFGGGYRLPLCELTDENKAKLRQHLKTTGVTQMSELKIALIGYGKMGR